MLQFCLQKPIFAPEPPASDDLSQFFEECRNPPNLDMFSSGNVMDVSAALVSYNLSQEVTCGDLNIECGTELELSYSKRQVLAVSSSWYYCIQYVHAYFQEYLSQYCTLRATFQCSVSSITSKYASAICMWI